MAFEDNSTELCYQWDIEDARVVILVDSLDFTTLTEKDLEEMLKAIREAKEKTDNA